MTGRILIIKSFFHYWRKNLTVALGVAVSTAVLTGALVVGDSMQYTLQKLVDLRLGATTHTITAGDRYITRDLATSLDSGSGIASTSVLQLEASAVVDGGQKRLPNIQILGIDASADAFFGLGDWFSNLSDNEVIISKNLADRLELNIGDNVLFRIRKASLIPLNAPFVSDEEIILPLRLTIKNIADQDKIGRFNLRNSQTAPFNAFISLKALDELMELGGKVNTILIHADDQAVETIEASLQKAWSLSDIGLKIDTVNTEEYQINSDRVFFDDIISESLEKQLPKATPILTYFVNSIESNQGKTPYSFVSGIQHPELSGEEIYVNTWLANDLKIKVGDSVSLNYFQVGPLRKLENGSQKFLVKRVVEMVGLWGDDKLMPDLPGLSDVGNCSDWETGVPIDLEAIRDTDEDYWDDWRGTPKAFISIETAEQIWANRFGNLTGIRVVESGFDQTEFENSFREDFDIRDLGFLVKDVRQQGQTAARNGVNFGELFLGLSFFVLLAGIILSLLLFGLTIQSRVEQLGLFRSLGLSKKSVLLILLGESSLTALLGGILGLGLTLLYNKMIFAGLNSIWQDIIRTDIIFLRLDGIVLLTGILISIVISLLGLTFSIRSLLKRELTSLNRGHVKIRRQGRSKPESLVGIFLLLVGIAIIVMQIVQNEINNPGLFFMAGGLLLLAFVLLLNAFLKTTGASKPTAVTVWNLAIKNLSRNRLSSLSVVLMLALGTFLVVTVGANRKNHFAGNPGPDSGTGGFTFFAETTAPFLKDMNSPEVKKEFNLAENLGIVQFRQSAGDDASCLNLNAISQPRILGVDPDRLSGRFTFATRTDFLDDEKPWESLNTEFEGNLIAGIADQTIIQWSLLKTVGDTLWYTGQDGKEFGIILIGGLASSVFQGNILISDEAFLERFPSSSGSGVFLIETDSQDSQSVEDELNMSLRDFGISIQTSRARLAEFSSIENTYLSIFLLLGALGLLIGTLGLGIVLARNIQQRQSEIALQRAIGLSKIKIFQAIVLEYCSLMLIGILMGSIAAIVSVLPGLLSPGAEVQISLLFGLIGAIILNGIIWILIFGRVGLNRISLISSLKTE